TVQVVTLDITTGRRTQLTRLPAGAITTPPDIFPTCCARFLNSGTIAFNSFANPSGTNPRGYFLAFTINRDGTALQAVPAPIAGPGGAVVSGFRIRRAAPPIAGRPS